MNTIFKLINSKKNNIYSTTNEYEFFAKNSHVLSKLVSVYKLRSYDEKTFKIIQSNIIIKAILNKNKIEKMIKDNPSMDTFSLLKNMEDDPYFEVDGNKIYIPIYSKGLNFIYTQVPNKLLSYPYNELEEDIASSCIDLFDVYNYYLYESKFSNLLKIRSDKTSSAFYHPEFETIYIINKQGRLDLSIRLFDKDIKEKEYRNFNDRLFDVVSAFYSNQRDIFVNSLFDNKFISNKMYKKLIKKISISEIKKDKYVKGEVTDEVL